MLTAVPAILKSPEWFLYITLQACVIPQRVQPLIVLAHPLFTAASPVSTELQVEITSDEISIDLKRLRSPDRLRYQSAIAHRLAAQNHCPVAAIANQILTQLLAYTTNAAAQASTVAAPKPLTEQIPPAIWQGLTVEATPTGYLQFEWHDRAIAIWLHTLLNTPFETAIAPTNAAIANPDSAPVQSTALQASALPKHLFTFQQTHARCCSWLRQAQAAHLIELHPRSPLPILAATAIPWLDANHHLLTQFPSERHLIIVVLSTLDELVLRSPDFKRSLHLTAALSQAIQTVHQTSQLFGNLQATSRDRVQAHLALIAIAQQLLHYLLETKLGFTAPSEL